MSALRTNAKRLLLSALLGAALAPAAQAAQTWDDFTRNPDRVMPNPGMLIEDLRVFYGEPATTHREIGGAETEVWDYGTFRAYVADGIVQRSKLW